MKLTETAKTKGYVQLIPPAGGGRENAMLLLAACVTLILSALIILSRSQHLQSATLAPYQIDLATALSASEQGLYTDLQTVYNELQQLKPSAPPPADYWAQDGWPPFAGGLSAAKRGAFRWQLLAAENFYAYWGRSEDGHELLWRLPATGFADAAQAPIPDIWLRRNQTTASLPAAPQNFADSALISHGWQQIAAHSAQLEQPPHPN